MQRWLQRGLFGLGALVAVGVLLLATGLVLAERTAQRELRIAVHPVPARADAAALAHGRRLYAARGCVACHGADGAGRAFVDDPGTAVRLVAPNLTRGSGSATAAYHPVDWVRAVRHGIKPDGRPLRAMPSEDYTDLSDADLGALVGYIESLAPVAGQRAQLQLPLAERLRYGWGVTRDAAAKIDHRLPHQEWL